LENGNKTIAIAGLGKIALDQHVPAIANTSGFRLAATLSRNTSLEDIPGFTTWETLRATGPRLDALAICTPPQVRMELAYLALEVGLDVLLEKPPAATVAEILALKAAAKRQGRVLFASWHSRHARAVPAATAWLADKKIRKITVTWRENVRQWHPGQSWIWQPGGLGVFDPGINALSILTAILPAPLAADLHVTAADLEVPENCATPIAARLTLAAPGGLEASADFDFRQTGIQTWSIDIETDSGHLALQAGGADLFLDGQPQPNDPNRGSEYEELYRYFARLVQSRRSDVDISPLVLVADAFLLGRQIPTEAFHD